MSRKILFAIIPLALMALTSCTKQQKVRTFGGNEAVKIEKKRKLISATWKGDNLWILTRPMREGEVPETYFFTESSSFGVWEGSITFIEPRD